MIKVDWTIWLQFANFFLLMLVLNFLLYRPLRGVLARRKENIDGGHARARALEESINEKMAAYQQKLETAKVAASKEKAALRQAGLEQDAAIVGKARSEATDQVAVIRNRVQAEAAEAGKVLERESRSIAENIASKILGRAL